MKTVLIMVLVIIGLIAGWVLLKPKPRPINGFGDCVNAGHPIQESYPRVCRTPDGRSFTSPVDVPINE